MAFGGRPATQFYHHQGYMRLGELFLVLFSITDRSSFENSETIVSNILRVKDSDLAPPIVLIGTKSDLSEEREVHDENIQQMSTKLNIPYVETSAKTGHNIEKAFEIAVKRFIDTSPRVSSEAVK